MRGTSGTSPLSLAQRPRVQSSPSTIPFTGCCFCQRWSAKWQIRHVVNTSPWRRRRFAVILQPLPGENDGPWSLLASYPRATLFTTCHFCQKHSSEWQNRHAVSISARTPCWDPGRFFGPRLPACGRRIVRSPLLPKNTQRTAETTRCEQLRGRGGSLPTITTGLAEGQPAAARTKTTDRGPGDRTILFTACRSCQRWSARWQIRHAVNIPPWRKRRPMAIPCSLPSHYLA